MKKTSNTLTHILFWISAAILVLVLLGALFSLRSLQRKSYASSGVGFTYPSRYEVAFEPETSTLIVGNFLRITDTTALDHNGGHAMDGTDNSTMNHASSTSLATATGYEAVKIGKATFYRHVENDPAAYEKESSNTSADNILLIFEGTQGKISITYPVNQKREAEDILRTFQAK